MGGREPVLRALSSGDLQKLSNDSDGAVQWLANGKSSLGEL